MKTLLVGLGGFLGAIARYLLGGLLNRMIPWPTLGIGGVWAGNILARIL